MKKLLVVMLVLAMASAANAGLVLSVNGLIDPPDTSITINESDIVTIDVYSDGLTTTAIECYLTVTGPGVMDISSGWLWTAGAEGGVDDRILDLGDGMTYLDFAVVTIPIPNIPAGTVVDYLLLHCEGPGDVVLLLGSTPGGDDFDTQVIHQIPEPMTIVLLGLGGLMLRRRK